MSEQGTMGSKPFPEKFSKKDKQANRRLYHTDLTGWTEGYRSLEKALKPSMGSEEDTRPLHDITVPVTRKEWGGVPPSLSPVQ